MAKKRRTGGEVLAWWWRRKPAWESELESAIAGIIDAFAAERRREPPWLRAFPSSAVFVDVETTGLASDDRIVTLAALRLEIPPLAEQRFLVTGIHLIFDPGRKSHPRAREVHGYTDAVLRRQEGFSVYADAVREHIESADLVVAHNADFDLGFINRELHLCGLAPISRPVHCTMRDYRARSAAGATLDAICARMGIARTGERHGAAEDAWLAMLVFLWLGDCPARAPFPEDQMPIVNLR